MTSTVGADATAALRTSAADHLWLHFSRMGAFRDGGDLPIIVRGDGCYLEDIEGRRYLDALAGLAAVQIGYGYGEEIGLAALAQMRELPYYTNWSYAHPRSIELAAKLASLAPPGLDRVFLTSGGSEANESAIKLARQYFARRGERRWKLVARRRAYHGTTLGALSLTGIPAIRGPFEPLLADTVHVSNTDRFRRPAGESEDEFTAFLLDEMESAIVQAGPETVAMVVLEPVQNAGGSFMPPAGYFEGVREICDRHGVLLCADEVICGFGRLGEWFASTRFGIEPDLITCAKGITSAYGCVGALIASDRLFEPFGDGGDAYLHGLTFGGHPVQAAIALKNLEIIERLDLLGEVRRREDRFIDGIRELLELPIVGDVRGAGYFLALELVSDPDTKATFDAAEREWLLRNFLSTRLFEAGLICRADDRANSVVQLSPPLVAGEEEFDRITGVLGDVLAEAWTHYQARRPG
jgi:adenosylmethionine-8-amino-7-oxononanoate aminotransferase